MNDGHAVDLDAVPPLFPGSEVVYRRVGQHQTSGPDRQLHAEGQRREAVRRLHARPRGRVLRDRPRRQGHLGAAINEPDPRRAGPDRGRRGRRVHRARRRTSSSPCCKFGSLPFPISELSSEQISATLGEQFLNQSLLAGAIGIALVILFMLIYYRLPGLVASFALLYYTLVVLAIFRLSR